MINKIGIGYNIRQIIYRIKLFKITDEKIYADIFTTHIKNVEEEYYDDCLFAFLGNYYDCPIIDAPFLNEKESLHSETYPPRKLRSLLGLLRCLLRQGNGPQAEDKRRICGNF